MDESTHKQALPLGYCLQNYRIEGVLGVGGFGVTYLAHARDPGPPRRRSRSTCRTSSPCATAPRCMPKSDAATARTLNGALPASSTRRSTLARFRAPRTWCACVDYFEANSTAYIVMDYEDGEPLDRLLERHGTLSEAQLKRVLLPIVDGLRAGARRRLPAPRHQAGRTCSCGARTSRPCCSTSAPPGRRWDGSRAA